jgi:chemotaxis protein CheY-P-specific phosphatase CheC
MPDEHLDQLSTAFTDVVERIGFMMVEPNDEAPAEAGDAMCVGRIAFTGATMSGRLALLIPAELCVELSANMRGVDADAISSTEADDALKELMNVTCGRFLKNMFGGEVEFDLSSPTAEPANAGAWPADGEDAADVLDLLLEFVPVRLSVSVQSCEPTAV